MIDPSARVEAGATIGKDVSIGPYCVIGPHVTIGDNCRLHANVHIAGHTTIGPRTVIYPFASLGTPPQSVHYRGGPTRLVVGADCDIREHVTMNIGTAGSGGTKVGDRCMLMVGAHVGHDCVIGNDVVFANNATLGGFVQIGDHVFLGGLCAVQQFARIGESVIVGGLAGVAHDVIPYAAVVGHRAGLAGLNRVGLRRRGLSNAEIQKIYSAYRGIFFGAGALADRLARTADEHGDDTRVMRMIEFIRAGKRRLTLPRRGHGDSD